MSAMLERNYGVSGKNGLAEQFESVASQLAAEYWRDHSRDILGIVADSYLEEYDDYNIEVPEQPLGKYGRMRQKYLKEHRPILWNQMILEETLFPHLLEIEQAAQSRLEQMMPELAAEAGATEALKARDPMKWVGLMNTCKAQAEEVILAELIYA